jgi:hypothetical protein
LCHYENQPKRQEVIFRKMHNQEIHHLHFSLHVARMTKPMRWIGHAARICKMRNPYKIAVGEIPQ